MNKIHFSLIIILSLFHFSSDGQGNTPYAQFGIGEVLKSNFQSNFSIGGLSSSIRSKKLLNPKNPASYSAFKYTIAEVNLDFNQTYSTQNNINSSNYKTNISGFGLGIPLGSNWGLALGFQPLSASNYSFSEKGSYSDLSTVKYTYEGSGGINQVFLGTGFKFKLTSFGINAKYLFGRINDIKKIAFYNSNFENTRFQNIKTISGFTGSIGLQQELKYDEKHLIIIGGSVSINNSIPTKNFLKTNYFVYTSDSLESHDSKSLFSNESNPSNEKLTLPLEYSFGLAYQKIDKWTIGFDYEYSNWSKLNFINGNNGFKDSQYFILGAEFTPNESAIGTENYWKMINYRLGAYFGESPYTYSGLQAQEFGINFGLSFPLRKMKYDTEKFGSYILTSFGYGKRGFNNNLISEDIFTVKFAIVLNDKWFIKRKFN